MPSSTEMAAGTEQLYACTNGKNSAGFLNCSRNLCKWHEKHFNLRVDSIIDANIFIIGANTLTVPRKLIWVPEN